MNYRRLNKLSVFSIFLLFVLGGLVRSTGSGMGCPDWPKCFGEYIPPTSESELPSDYEDYYKNQRIVKTERFVGLLKGLGFNKQAQAILDNPQVEESHEFNVSKAYVEYVNRLWGAVTGLVVFACFVFSIPMLKSDPKVFIFTAIGFAAVFANALLGAVVVHSNLLGGIVTLHFIAAFIAIAAFLLAQRFANNETSYTYDYQTKSVIIILTILSFIQVLAGASLRESYDLLSVSTWSEKVSNLYPNLHTHAILGVLVMVVCIWQFIKFSGNQIIKKYVFISMICGVLQVVIGPLALSDSLAAFSKLFHITLGAGLFIAQFYICTTLIKTSAVNQNYT